jgi:hypothetical protein
LCVAFYNSINYKQYFKGPVTSERNSPRSNVKEDMLTKLQVCIGKNLFMGDAFDQSKSAIELQLRNTVLIWVILTQSLFRNYSFLVRAWSFQQKFSDLINFQKKSENFKPTIFVRKVRKISC